MRLLVSLLLIPGFVLGQLLPHTHAGSDTLEPDHHSIRPHIHIGGHHHGDVTHHHDGEHGHDHDGHAHHESEKPGKSEFGGLSAPADHDSSAVYLPDSDWTAHRVQSHRVDLALVAHTLGNCDDVSAIKPAVQIASGPPDRRATLPVYLLTASLRL